MHPLIYLFIFVISAYLLLSSVQARPSFLLLLPILILTIGIGWYLNRHIQKEHEEDLKKNLRYTMDEQEAQHWLHQSFVPKANILFKKHIKEILLYSGLLLALFIFVWSYFVAGLFNALLNVLIASLLYCLFIFYTLHADKWYTYFFHHVPRQYKHFKNNNWIHGYVILLPFTFFCFLFYFVFNYNGAILAMALAIPLFFFTYTLVFVCLYSGFYLYNEYRKEEEQALKKSVKKMMTEEDK